MTEDGVGQCYTDLLRNTELLNCKAGVEAQYQEDLEGLPELPEELWDEIKQDFKESMKEKRQSRKNNRKN